MPFGEHADRLLDPDPRGERVLKLHDGDRESLSLTRLG